MLETLLEIENALARGDGDTYRAHLTEDALVVIPGGHVLTREETAEAMDAGPGWDTVAMVDARIVGATDASAVLTYRFDGDRGDEHYAAIMSSAYVRRDGTWRLALHQQTPVG